MSLKERRKLIDDIFLQKEVNLETEKMKRAEERRKKIQGFLNRPLIKTRSQKKKKGKKRGGVNVQRGIKGLTDLI